RRSGGFRSLPQQPHDLLPPRLPRDQRPVIHPRQRVPHPKPRGGRAARQHHPIPVAGQVRLQRLGRPDERVPRPPPPLHPPPPPAPPPPPPPASPPALAFRSARSLLCGAFLSTEYANVGSKSSIDFTTESIFDFPSFVPLMNGA